MSNIEVKEEFKYRLEKALAIRGMRPKDLAVKSGISESTISQYRSGYAKPKEKKLALIASVLNVNPTWLMGLDVPMEQYPVDYITNEGLVLHKEPPKFDFDRLEFILNEYKKSKDKTILTANVDNDLIKAIELFGLYENSSPEVRNAVEVILRSAQQKP